MLMGAINTLLQVQEKGLGMRIMSMETRQVKN